MDRLTVTFVNVGYGEAILLECPDGSGGIFRALIDGGSAENDEFADCSTGRIRMEDFLKKRGISRLNLAVSTHIHEDHLCGLLRAVEAAPADTLWQPLPGEIYRNMQQLDTRAARTPSESKFLRALNDYEKLCGLQASRGGTLCTPEAGQTITAAPNLTIEILGPILEKRHTFCEEIRELYRAEEGTDDFFAKLDALDAHMNNYSFILMLRYMDVRVLLPGDTNAAGYRGIAPEHLRANLFKVGHHGQKDGADRSLIEAVCPEYVICCASSDRRYNSANPELLQMMQRSGAKLCFSDCPPVNGVRIPPHEALQFTIYPCGETTPQYLK